MKYLFLILAIGLLSKSSIAQSFAIGTDSPDPNAILELQSSSKGVLIPRLTTAQRNANLGSLTIAQRGLLIYNLDDAGFNYWDGSAWVSFPGISGDADWHEEGTTSAPNDINDDIFHLGNVAIGKNTADYALDVESNNSSRGLNIEIEGNSFINGGISGQYISNNNSSNSVLRGIENIINSNGAGTHTGINNSILSNGSGHQYGIKNFLSNSGSGDKFGIITSMLYQGNASTSTIGHKVRIDGTGDGNVIGNSNKILCSGDGEHIGTKNEIYTTGVGSHYGSYNTIEAINGLWATNSYGVFTKIFDNLAGNHYGIYSEVLKAGPNTWAGYFLGDVYIGTSTANGYNLPAIDGTSNQILQTDGSGQLSWTTPTNGDITGVTAGNGLTGGGTTGNITINAVASNGLTTGTNNITLGGALSQATTITQGTYNYTHNLNSTGDFNIQDNGTALFKVDASTRRIGILEATPNFDLHLKQSTNIASGTGGIGLENSTSTDNWKVYHSGFNLSFSENGVRRAYITGASGTYVVTSDRRLKKDITEVESILDGVNKLRAYRYLYLDQDASDEKTIGFMAQDVEPLFPELVEMGEDGYYGMNYAGFGVIAVKAIQEQQDEIDELRAENESLKENQKSLEERLQTIEEYLKEE